MHSLLLHGEGEIFQIQFKDDGYVITNRGRPTILLFLTAENRRPDPIFFLIFFIFSCKNLFSLCLIYGILLHVRRIRRRLPRACDQLFENREWPGKSYQPVNVFFTG